MNTPYSEDARQVQLCLTGDTKAFEPLVRRYQNAAFATALGFVSDNLDAQDLVQDAFLTAYTKLGQLRRPETFGRWLRQIVVNRCKRWLTRQPLKSPIEAAESLLVTAANGRHHDQAQQMDLWDAVHRLSESHRSLLLMHYLSGWPYTDMAVYMDIPMMRSSWRAPNQRSASRPKMRSSV